MILMQSTSKCICSSPRVIISLSREMIASSNQGSRQNNNIRSLPKPAGECQIGVNKTFQAKKREP